MVQKINQVEGEGVVVNKTAQLWFKKFSQGDTSLKRRKGFARTCQVNTDVISDVVKQAPMIWFKKVKN